jgi:hypothetical protein
VERAYLPAGAQRNGGRKAASPPWTRVWRCGGRYETEDAARSRLGLGDRSGLWTLEEGDDESDWRLAEAVAAPAGLDRLGRTGWAGLREDISWAASVLGS